MCMSGGCPGSSGHNPMASTNRSHSPAKQQHNYVHRQGHIIGTSSAPKSKTYGSPRVKFSGRKN